VPWRQRDAGAPALRVAGAAFDYQAAGAGVLAAATLLGDRQQRVGVAMIVGLRRTPCGDGGVAGDVVDGVPEARRGGSGDGMEVADEGAASRVGRSLRRWLERAILCRRGR